MTTEVKKRILAAEDNFINKRVLEKIFHNRGWDILVVDNGRSAIEEVQHNKYDAVLMDIRMPDIDGFEATLVIRKFNTSIPIIAVTANAATDFRKKCIDTGMNDFITKPFKKETLFEVLDKYLNL